MEQILYVKTIISKDPTSNKLPKTSQFPHQNFRRGSIFRVSALKLGQKALPFSIRLDSLSMQIEFSAERKNGKGPPRLRPSVCVWSPGTSLSRKL